MNIKYIGIVLVTSFLASCMDSALPPIFDIGDRVYVSKRLTGTVVEHRSPIGAKPLTSDYRVQLDVGSLIWYDEEVLTKIKKADENLGSDKNENK